MSTESSSRRPVPSPRKWARALRRLRPALLLFALSLGIRALVLLALGNELPVGFDEIGYLQRAIAWQEILDGPGDLHIPDSAVWGRAYGLGRWPPLHPFLMGLGLLLTGGAAAAGRWVVVLVSALTTPLVYGLGRELAGRRAALAGSALHALYPTFIAYSHYLWSETTFVFLLLAATWLSVRTVDAEDDRRALARAAGAGIAAGLAVLTRAPGLPLVLVLPVWIFCRARRGVRTRAALLAAALIAALAAPWQLAVARQEPGPVFLSTQGGYNLALGNHPEVPPGYGSSWAHPESKRLVEGRVRELAAERAVSFDQAARGLALEEIRRRPGAALGRSLERLRMLWAPDVFPLRHLFHGLYPPARQRWGALALGVVVSAYLLLVGLSIRGLLSPCLRARPLLVALLAAGSLMPLATIGMSRLHLPLLALLLPAAGLGAIRGGGPRRPWPLLAALGLFLALTLPAWPLAASRYLRPSSHYAPLFARLDRLLGTETELNDAVELRRFDAFEEVVEVRIVNPGTSFDGGSRRRRWAPEEKTLRMIFWSRPGAEIELELTTSKESRRFSPIESAAWQRWRLGELPGTAWRWGGGETDVRASRWPDIDPPTRVLALESPSHDSPSSALEVTLRWAPAIDGVRNAHAYAAAVDRSQSWSCGGEPTPAELLSTTGPLAEGLWYGHVCAIDAEGNRGPVATVGPLVIDRSPPRLLRIGPSAHETNEPRLTAGFSEEVRGAGSPEDVRIVAAGADGRISTLSCAARARGDDRLHPATSVTATEDGRGVEIALAPRPLAPGLYRLLVCREGALHDRAGLPFARGESLDFRIDGRPAPPSPPLFDHDFESGDLSAWEASAPSR